MMKRNMSEIKKELKERGIKEIGKEELSNWALVFAIEDLVRETKKPFMIKGVETLVEGLEKK
ncbi:MAG TPA: hypothetical protein VJ895_00035 [Candidatus Nanoarchaeia archaeon]|nr:hypothetical protein [Candidatus Nanoarchaeia archaeon]